jgi:putative salt-induced outer membrane protein
MRMHIQRCLWSVLLSLAVAGLAPALWAEEKKWSDTAELSFVQTSGNTDVTSFAAKNLLEYRHSDEWAFSWKAAGLFAKTDDEKSAERYETDLRADYTASQRHYYFGLAGWKQDKFAGLDQRFFAGPGIGYLIIARDRHVLSAELGAQYAKEDYTDGTRSEFIEGRAYGKYEYRFSDTVIFSEELEYLHNFKDSAQYSIISITAMQTKLTDLFALRVAYEIRYHNRPTPEELKNTDTVLTVSLVVTF